MTIHEVAYWNAMVGGHAMYMLRILLIILNRCPNKGFKMNVVTSGALLSNCSHRNLVSEVAVYKKIILEIASHLHSLRFQIMTICS